jgi:hypothetical protein
MGSLTEWLIAFRALHEKARRGQLHGPDAARYQAARDELARALLAAQRLQLKPGETPRSAMRVSLALQVELSLPVNQRALTADLSTGGFSCVLGPRGAPASGTEADFSMKLPGGATLAGRARVQDVKPLPGAVRVSFMFTGLPNADRERMEMLVLDTALAQLSPRP